MEAANQESALADEHLSDEPAAQVRWSRLRGLADESIADGRLADAGDHCKNALEIAREHGPGSTWLAESYIRLADIAAGLDQADAALRLYGHGAAILDSRPDGVSALLAHAVSNMGRLHMLRGETGRGLELTTAADALQRNLNTPDSPAIKLNLALVAATAGHDDDADRAFQDCLAAAERCRNAIGSLMFAVHDNFAQYAMRRGRNGDAEMALRSCLILRQEAAGPRHPVYADGLVNLARLHLVAGAEDEAETLLWQASEVYRRHEGAMPSTLVEALYLLARMAQQHGRAADAETLCGQLLALGETSSYAAPAAKAAELHILLLLHGSEADRLEVEATMRRALGLANGLKGGFGRLGGDICSVLLRDLADLLTQIGKGAEAGRLMARAEELHDRPQWTATGFVFIAV